MSPRDGQRGAEERLAESLDAAARRLRTLHLLRATAIAAVAGTVASLALRWTSLAAATRLLVAAVTLPLTAAAAWWLLRGRWTSSAAAAALERVRPESRNVLVTAEELRRDPARGAEWVRARVFADAAAIADGLPARDVVPIRREAAGLVAALALLAIAGAPGVDNLVHDTASRVFPQFVPDAPSRLSATVVPPAYLSMQPRTLENPQEIDAVRGSRLEIEIHGTGDWRVRFGTTILPARRDADSVVAGMLLEETGYLALESEGDEAFRRLIPVTVRPDRAPVVRIEDPGKDLLVPDGNGSIAVAASATDDFGLRALALKFTKISGSGEQFEFEEGTLPLRLERETERSWRGRGRIDLAALRLSPGDSLVYRVVGHDARADGAGSSETFYVEVAGPGQVTLAGFGLSPDRDRHALSQQMIVVKIERLRAREKTLDPEALREETASIAAEQRAVRANFIFLTGGHVEDEEEETAHSHEIQEGRLENTARSEIGVAIQHMTRAEQALTAVQTGAALPPARAAVEALQRAFGRNRYFLRTMPVRSRLDPSRRLTGGLEDAADWPRQDVDRALDPAGQTACDILGALMDVAASRHSGSDRGRSRRLADLAERALAVDVGSEDWLAISRGLQQLAGEDDMTGSGVERSLSDLMTRVIARVRRWSIPADRTAQPDSRLFSSWVEAQRRP